MFGLISADGIHLLYKCTNMAGHKQRFTASTKTMTQQIEEQFFYGYINEWEHGMLLKAIQQPEYQVRFEHQPMKDGVSLVWRIEIRKDIV